MKTLISIIAAILITFSLQAQVNYQNNSVTGSNASALGSNNTSSGQESFSSGKGCLSSGNQSISLGLNTEATGIAAVSIGAYTYATGNSSVSLGSRSYASQTGGIAIGNKIKSNATFGYVIGYGITDNYLENNINNSLMIGFQSNVPTFFVGQSNGSGTTGKIGIGNVNDPQAKLHIRADNDENADLLLEPTGTGKYARLQLGSMNNRIDATLTGDMNFRTASDFVFWDANVGIGVNNPDKTLDVAGTLNADGAATFGSSADISGNLTVGGSSLLDKPVTINSTLSVAGTSVFSSSLGVNGLFSANGAADFNNNISVTGKTTTSELQVTTGAADGKLLQSDANGNATWVDPMTLNVDDGDWTVNGDDVYRLNGNVGIGTSSPVSRLQIVDNTGNVDKSFLEITNNAVAGGTTIIGKHSGNGIIFVQKAGADAFTNGGGPSLTFEQRSNNNDVGITIRTFTTGGGEVINASIDAKNSDLHLIARKNLIFRTDENADENIRMIITQEGNVKMTGQLIVAGKIEASEIEVKEITKWQDDVFKPEYNLRTLSETERFIKQNGHLPEIPSEKEVMKNGYNISEMDAKLLQKIEELTLYVIELKKEINELKNKE